MGWTSSVAFSRASSMLVPCSRTSYSETLSGETVPVLQRYWKMVSGCHPPLSSCLRTKSVEFLYCEQHQRGEIICLQQEIWSFSSMWPTYNHIFLLPTTDSPFLVVILIFLMWVFSLYIYIYLLICPGSGGTVKICKLRSEEKLLRCNLKALPVCPGEGEGNCLTIKLSSSARSPPSPTPCTLLSCT